MHCDSLVCPLCKISLTKDNKEWLYCNGCRNKWYINDGVPHFIDTDTYWAEPGFTREVLQEINENLEHGNWKDILSSHKSSLVREQYTFIANLERAKWHKLMSLPNNSVVLDMGAGMGTISHALSQHYGTIYAVESVKERVKFMKLRFKQEDCSNIVLIRSDIDHLPFKEESFDLIVLNGVLEWLPFSKKEENPRKAQLFYLKLLRKLLKKNGYLYIGIENRFSYGLFIGALDPHISLKYVTILPRLLSHIICKYKIRDIYRPYLYSHKGYKHLLKNAGFKNIEIYSVLPSYNEPQYLINIKNNSSALRELILTSKKKPVQFIKKILLKTNILKYFGHSYAIMAKNV